jgi:hypothetical protein
MEKPAMEHERFESPKVFYLPFPANPSNNAAKNEASLKSSMPPLVLFQLVVTIGLAVLASFLQFEFYREHDVLPGYAWPLAIAGTVGMLSLATVKFDGFWSDLPRKLLYGSCYIFMILSSSFHVANEAWNRSAKLPRIEQKTNSSVPLAQERGLQVVIDALKVATKNRAWNAMETLGVEVSKQAATQASVSPAKPLGVSQDLMIWFGAGITVLLRALLEGIQAVNAVALRKFFGNILPAKE